MKQCSLLRNVLRTYYYASRLRTLLGRELHDTYFTFKRQLTERWLSSTAYLRRATSPRQPPQPLRGRSRRNQLLLPHVPPARRAPSTRSSRCVLSRERARAWLRALAGPQALQHHAALPGASTTHQGRCAVRPLSRSRPHRPPNHRRGRGKLVLAAARCQPAGCTGRYLRVGPCPQPATG